MRVLVVGSGGREHALAWALARSERVEQVFVAPGNAGTALEPRCRNIDLQATDIDGLVAFATEQAIGMTVIGPEAPLVAGIVDRFRSAGLPCLGPAAAAARLEGSKQFSKDFMRRHGIPTADYAVHTELAPALAHVAQCSLPVVIKADGLAAGKGVVIAHERAQAEAAVRAMLETGRFGAAGARVVIEAFLEGEEASFIVLVDGTHCLPLATSQDHKARDDGDRGPNTGGMGACSPAPVVTPAVAERVMRTIVEPTVRGMAAEGVPYTGFLYAGLMIDRHGEPSVLEYNCRLGDPEAQPLLLRLETDLLDLCEAAVQGRLDAVDCVWSPDPAVAVVLAAGGYPDDYARDMAIEGLSGTVPESARVFHAGTRLAQDGAVLTAGGRVLTACATGVDLDLARERAYALAAAIHWPGRFYRSDIGRKALARMAGQAHASRS